jgi:hypothetical protein
MSVTRPHVGDIGTPFYFNCVQEDGSVIDLAAATQKTATFVLPNKTTVDKQLDIVDADAGIVRYVTVSGDLGLSGRWKVQAFIITPDGEWYSDVEEFIVYPNVPKNEVA